MVRRGLVIAAGWVSAVGASAVFGVATISALATEAGPGGPLSQQEVSDRLAQTPLTSQVDPARSGEPGPPLPTTATASAVRKYVTTSGGGVWASCTRGQATLDTMTPRQGFRLDGYDKGPAKAAWVKFKLDVQHGHGDGDEYQVTVTCAGGIPQVEETTHD